MFLKSILIIAGLFFLCLSGGNAQVFPQTASSVPHSTSAADLSWRTEIGGEIGSEFLFRGIRFYDGAYISPYFSLFSPLEKKTDIVFQLLGNFPLQGERQGRRFYEISPSIYYQKTSGPGTASVGAIGYFYDGNYAPPPGNTGEIFGSLAFDAVLNPSFSLFQDIDESHARYFELELKHDIPWDFYDASLSFAPFVVLGYAYHTSETQYGSDGLNHVAVGIKCRIKRPWGIIQPRMEIVHAKDENTVDTVLASIVLSFKEF